MLEDFAEKVNFGIVALNYQSDKISWCMKQDKCTALKLEEAPASTTYWQEW